MRTDTIMEQQTLEGFDKQEKAALRTRLLRRVDAGTESDRQRAWKRFTHRVANTILGDAVLRIYRGMTAGPASRQYREMEGLLFASQDRFDSPIALRNWLKVGVGWCTWAPGTHGGIVPISLAADFNLGDEVARQNIRAALITLIHSDHAGRFLWPHLKPAERVDLAKHLSKVF